MEAINVGQLRFVQKFFCIQISSELSLDTPKGLC
jgi:hypothetical protein